MKKTVINLTPEMIRPELLRRLDDLKGELSPVLAQATEEQRSRIGEALDGVRGSLNGDRDCPGPNAIETIGPDIVLWHRLAALSRCTVSLERKFRRRHGLFASRLLRQIRNNNITMVHLVEMICAVARADEYCVREAVVTKDFLS